MRRGPAHMPARMGLEPGLGFLRRMARSPLGDPVRLLETHESDDHTVDSPVEEREGHRRMLAGSDTSKSSSGGTGQRGLPKRGKPATLVAGQSWRVSMNAGIWRVVSAWTSPREGYC